MFVRSVAVVISRPRDEVFALIASARTTQGNLDRSCARLKGLLETGAASATT